MNKINKILLGEISNKQLNINHFIDYLNEKHGRSGLVFSNENNAIIIYNYTKLEKRELSKFEGILEGINYDETSDKTGRFAG
jgi:hypothetical protein